MNKAENVLIKKRINLVKKKFNENNIDIDDTRISDILDCVVIDNEVRGTFSGEDEVSSVEKYKIKNEVLCILETLLDKKIPEYYKDEILLTMVLRFKVIQLQGYALISKNWIKLLADWIGNRKCLEIMAGNGTLSYALQSEGKSVIATDGYKWSQFDFNSLWTDVERIDALDAIEKYGRDVDIIIMSWCYMDELGYQSLLKMREVNPKAIMLYIGEPWGGCTGSDSLYENMIEIEDKDIDKINNIYPTWKYVHDRLFLIK